MLVLLVFLVLQLLLVLQVLLVLLVFLVFLKESSEVKGGNYSRLRPAVNLHLLRKNSFIASPASPVANYKLNQSDELIVTIVFHDGFDQLGDACSNVCRL